MNIKYRVVYSRRKTLSITIKECEVVVRAPYKTSLEYISNVVKSHEKWIVSKISLQRERLAASPDLSEVDISRVKAEAREYFNALIHKYSKIMGLKCGRISITSAKKRFGSCNSKGNICFSYRLMLYPEAAREYVVVHELAHLIELNHSPRFYAIVEKYMPDYRERKKLLS